MKTLILTVAAIAAAGTAPTAAQATAVVREIAVANAGFEAQPMGPGGYTNNAITGWHVGGGVNTAGAMNPLPAWLPANPQGNHVAYLNSFRLWNGYTSAGDLWQDTGETVKAGTRYRLSAKIGLRADVASLPDFVAQLTAGGTVLASATLTNAQVARGTFETLAFDYVGTAGVAGPLTINFRSTFNEAQGLDCWQAEIDDVSLTAVDATAAVPEPASWAMMIGGFGAVGSTMRRRRRVAAAA